MPIRVVFAEDSYLVREGVQRLLEGESDLEVVAICENLDTLLTAIEAEQPDVVVTDIRMPPTERDEGIQVADRLRETAPEMGVVVLSQFADPQYALALLDKGADRRAYLLKDRISDVGQLAGAIREVARGGSVIDPKVVEGLVAARSREESPLRSRRSGRKPLQRRNLVVVLENVIARSGSKRSKARRVWSRHRRRSRREPARIVMLRVIQGKSRMRR